MKKFLVSSSLISLLAISNNVISSNNKVNSNQIINNITENNDKLFSNTYGSLDNKSWIITNQSSNDHKYYSYDLSHADYLLSDNKTKAYSLFSVDEMGKLQCNVKNLPDIDKVEIANTLTEIDNDKKISTIKDTTNPVSKSFINNKYFNGSFPNWLYLQMGGVEKHIDISSQINANKIDNNNNLSEHLGFYYIAKAVIEKKIDEKVADSLAEYFINHSSFKDQISNESVDKIISLIIHNSNIYNFLYHMPFYINDKNYTLNFIFDGSLQQNLVEIFYYQWTNNDINNKINYSWGDSPWPVTENSNRYVLLKWKDYAKDWKSFASVYTNFNFDNKSKFDVNAGSTDNQADLTSKVLTTKISNTPVAIAHVHVYYQELPVPKIPTRTIDLDASLMCCHDDSNIYYQWYLTVNNENGGVASSFQCTLNNITFFNVMK